MYQSTSYRNRHTEQSITDTRYQCKIQLLCAMHVINYPIFTESRLEPGEQEIDVV